MTQITILLVVIVAFLLWYGARKFFDWLECPDKTERLIRQRKAQAVERNIYSQAKDIAWLSGQVSPQGIYVYKDTVLEVRLDTGQGGVGLVSVVFGAALVFQASYTVLTPSIDAYVPGEWEQHLSRLYRQVKDQELKSEAERLAKERDQTKKNFGL